MIKRIKKPIQPKKFLKRIYQGELICFCGIKEIKNIVVFTRNIIENLNKSNDPLKIHENFSENDFLSICLEFQKSFRNSEYIFSQWESFFNHLGFPSNKLFMDRIYARILTNSLGSSKEKSENFITNPLPIHRDTWGSNLYSQVNWWAPLYPINKGESMSLFPKFWDIPIKNNSQKFDLPKIIRSNKNLSKTGRKNLKTIPSVEQKIDLNSGIDVLIEPGDILAFSGSHAHASNVLNSTFTRYSFETRTIFLDDFLHSMGSKNIDGASSWMAPGWFKRISDGKRLSEKIDSDTVCKFIPDKKAISGSKVGS